MKAPDLTTLTNKSFENKYKREHKSRGLEVPILDMISQKEHYFSTFIMTRVKRKILNIFELFAVSAKN